MMASRKEEGASPHATRAQPQNSVSVIRFYMYVARSVILQFVIIYRPGEVAMSLEVPILFISYGIVVECQSYSRIIDKSVNQPNRKYIRSITYGTPTPHFLMPCETPRRPETCLLMCVHAYAWQRGHQIDY
jgi:hypothetical protein